MGSPCMVAILFVFVLLLPLDGEFAEVSPAPDNPEELGKSSPLPFFSNSEFRWKTASLAGAQAKTVGGPEGASRRRVSFEARAGFSARCSEAVPGGGRAGGGPRARAESARLWPLRAVTRILAARTRRPSAQRCALHEDIAWVVLSLNLIKSSSKKTAIQ